MTTERITLLLVVLAASGLTSLALIPFARWLAQRIGLVDRPDGRRKMHAQAIPVSGGIALLASATLVLAALLCVPGVAALFLPCASEMRGLLLGAVLICALGVADDYRGLRGRHKLLGQILAAGIVIGHGVSIEAVHLFTWRLELGWLALPFTLFWLLGAINSLNLLDGMDGLLGSIGTIISLAMAALAAWHGCWAEAFVAVTLGGVLLGFLCYNFPPASIFLGDAGSMLIGLVLGVLAIRSSLKGPATVALAAPTALLILPIFDTTAAILRRRLTGRSIYSTDRGHLHHCLLRSGFSRPRALAIVVSLCLLTVLGVLGSIASQNEALALLSAAAVVAILVVTRLFGHAEMMLVLKSAGALARSFSGASGENGHQVEVRLQGSANWCALWRRLLICADGVHLRSLVLDVNAPAMQEGYHARWFSGPAPEPQEGEVWSVDIPLTAAGQSVGRLTITGLRDSEAVWRKVAAVAEVAEQIEAILERQSQSLNLESRAPDAEADTVPVAVCDLKVGA
jgi:UDP-GlcNAc:undecaprenyl-phosphate GlcNAc-1-phosphate transferase